MATAVEHRGSGLERPRVSALATGPHDGMTLPASALGCRTLKREAIRRRSSSIVFCYTTPRRCLRTLLAPGAHTGT